MWLVLPALSFKAKRLDIITKFDGQSVSSMEELKDLMEYYEAGDEVEITIQTQKDGGYAEEKHTVKLGAKSDT